MVCKGARKVGGCDLELGTHSPAGQSAVSKQTIQRLAQWWLLTGHWVEAHVDQGVRLDQPVSENWVLPEQDKVVKPFDVV